MNGRMVARTSEQRLGDLGYQVEPGLSKREREQRERIESAWVEHGPMSTWHWPDPEEVK